MKIERLAYFLTLVSLGTVMVAHSAPVSEEMARTVASGFLEKNTVAQRILEGRTVDSVEAYENLWVANLAPSGHIIISGTTKNSPVLSFSQEDFTEPADDTAQMDMFESWIERCSASESDDTLEDNADWTKYAQKASTRRLLLAAPAGKVDIVEPFLGASWNQYAPWGDLSPLGRLSGCAATAGGMQLRYWRWPYRMEVSHTYEHTVEGYGKSTIRRNGFVPFNYDKILGRYDYIPTYKATDKIATYECAHLISWVQSYAHMIFKPGESASPHKIFEDVGNFLYEEGRPMSKGRDGITNLWEAIKADLDFGSPIQVNSSVHVMLVDGYCIDEETRRPWINLNLGWGSPERWVDLENEIDNATAGGGNLVDFQIGFRPQKRVQFEPLPVISSNDVSLAWHLPNCYTNKIEGFNLDVIEMTEGSFVDDFSEQHGSSSDETRMWVADGTLHAKYQAATYTYDDEIFLAKDSVLTFDLDSFHMHQMIACFDLKFDAGGWQTVHTENLTVSKSTRTGITVPLGEYVGRTAKLRIRVVAASAYYSDASLLIDNLAISNSRYVLSGNVVEGKSLGIENLPPACREVIISGLESGKAYAFCVKPVMTDGTAAVEAHTGTVIGNPKLPPEIRAVSTIAKGRELMQDGFFAELEMGGTNVVTVTCSPSTTSLRALPSHLTVLSDEKVSVVNNGNGVFKISLDTTNMNPCWSGDMILLTLIAANDDGTKTYKNLMLRFYAITSPLVTWSGDFNIEKAGFSFQVNGNQLSDDGATITITNNVGVKVDFDTGLASAMTVMFRYSDLAFDAQKTIATSFCSGYDENRTGVYLAEGGTANGISNSANWNNPMETLSQSSGTLAFCYSRSGGTSLYHIDADGVTSQIYLKNDLRYSSNTNETINGCTIGGERFKTGATLLPAATGMKITGVAIFDHIVEEVSMASYVWPYEIAVNENISVSELNERINDVGPETENIVLVVSDGVTIEFDEAFSTDIPIAIASDGDVRLAANSQLDLSCLRGVDFSGVKGGVLRSWLAPNVVGFNFDAQQGNMSSGAFVGGTWLYDNSSKDGSRTDFFADGLSTLTWTSSTVYQYNHKAGSFLNGYLDDGSVNGNGAEIRLTNIPFENYDVIIYAASDTDNGDFTAKTVNGTTYTWDTNELKVVEGNGNWGRTRNATPEYGTNALYIENLSGPLTIYGGVKDGDHRGGISAFQIIPPRYKLTLTGDIAWSKGTWTTASGDPIDFVPVAGRIEIVANAEATLTIDEDISIDDLTITGDYNDSIIFDIPTEGTFALGKMHNVSVLNVTGGGTLFCSASDTLMGTVKGSCIIEYAEGLLPDSSVIFTDSAWTGTNVFTKCGNSNNSNHKYVDLSALGNDNSFLKMPGYNGYLTNDVTCSATLVIDGGTTFNISNGDSGHYNIFKKIVGSGKIIISGDTTSTFQVVARDFSEFSGEIQVLGEGHKGIVVGAPENWKCDYENYQQKVAVAGHVTIASGKTWDVTDSQGVVVLGSGILEFAGTGETASISGLLALTNSAMVKLPEDAVFPYRLSTQSAMADDGSVNFYVGETDYTGSLSFSGGVVSVKSDVVVCATIGEGGDPVAWDDLDWNLNYPEALTNQVTAYANRTLNFGSSATANTAIFNVSKSATLTLTGTLTADEVVFAGNGFVNLSNATINGSRRVGEASTIAMLAGTEGTISVSAGSTLKLIVDATLAMSGYIPSGVTGGGSVQYWYIDGSELVQITSEHRISGISLSAVPTSYTNPVTGELENYTNYFFGAINGNWSTNDVANWNLERTPYVKGADDGGYNPGFMPAVFDGNNVFVADNTNVTCSAAEGWNVRWGFYNGVIATIDRLNKLQGRTNFWITVDSTSKVSINDWGGGNIGGNPQGQPSVDLNLLMDCYVASSNGITFGSDFATMTDGSKSLTFNYYFAGEGSVSYRRLEICNHVIKQADIVRDGTNEVKCKELVSFTSTTKTFAADALIKVIDGSGNLITNVTLTSITNGDTTLTADGEVGACELVQTPTNIVLYCIDGNESGAGILNVTDGIVDFYDMSNWTGGGPRAGNDLTINVSSGDHTIVANKEREFGDIAIVASGVDSVLTLDGMLKASNGLDVSGTFVLTPTSVVNAASLVLTNGVLKLEMTDEDSPTLAISGAANLTNSTIFVSLAGGMTPGVRIPLMSAGSFSGIESTMLYGLDSGWRFEVDGDTLYATSAIGSITVNDETTYYASLAAATNAANGSVIALLADTDEAIEIPAGQTVSIRKNGFTCDNVTIADVAANVSSNTVGGVTTYTSDVAKAAIGSSYYASLSNAVEAASCDAGITDVVRLLEDDSGNVALSGKAIMFEQNGHSFAGTLSGDGTMIITNSVPTFGEGGIVATNEQWSGVIWLKNATLVGLDPALVASANSTLRLTGCDGYFGPYTCAGTLDLQDEGETKAFVVSNFETNSLITVFEKLIGSGSLACADEDVSPYYVFSDVSEFMGSINCSIDATRKYLRAILGEWSWQYPAGGTITVANRSVATIADGKTWAAATNVVHGTLAFNGTGRMVGDVEVKLGATLCLTNSTVSTPIAGSLSLEGNVTVMLPESATFPHRIASSGSGHVDMLYIGDTRTSATLANGNLILDVASITVDDVTSYYTSLTAATNAANGNVITLLADTEEAIVIPAGETLQVIKGVYDCPNVSIDGFSADASCTTNDSGVATYTSYIARAAIGSTYYASLSNAVEAAYSDATNTVRLLGADSGNLVLNDKTIIFEQGDHSFSGTLTGNGTMIITNFVPTFGEGGIVATNEQWSGVIWLKNATLSDLDPALVASANSTLRLTGCSGNFLGGTCSGTLDLQDAENGSFTVTQGNGTATSSFAHLTGNGSFNAGERSIKQKYVFFDPSVFDGSISLDYVASKFRVILGDGTDMNPANGTITVVGETVATIADGKTWAASTNVVYGTLAFAGTGAMSGDVEVKPGATLCLTNSTAAQPISGAMTLEDGAIVKIPSNASIPYKIATSATANGIVRLFVGDDEFMGTWDIVDGSIRILSREAELDGGNVAWGDVNWGGLNYTNDTGIASTITVSEDTTLDLGSVSAVRVTFCVAENKTLTLAGSLTASEIIVNGPGSVMCSAATTLVGTLKGNGTIVYTNAVPTFGDSGIVATENEWEGVVWLKNATLAGINTALVAGTNSTLRLTGCTGYLNSANATQECAGTLDLRDEGETKAFTVNEGFSLNGVTVFAKLTGSGTITQDASKDRYQRYVFVDPTDFTGTVDLGSDSNRRIRVILGDGKTLAPDNSTITVLTNVTIAAGKDWTAPGGLRLATKSATITVPKTSTTPAPSTQLTSCIVAKVEDGDNYVYSIAKVAQDSAGTQYCTIDEALQAIIADQANESPDLEKVITLLYDTNESVTLPQDYILNVNSKTYGGTVTGVDGTGIVYDGTSGTYTCASRAAATWTGAAGDGLWANPTNWSPRLLPTENTAVTIANDVTIYVTGNNGDEARFTSLTVNANVVLSITDRSDNGQDESWPSVGAYGNISGTGSLTLWRMGIRNKTSSEIVVSVPLSFENNGTNDSYIEGGSFRFTEQVSATNGLWVCYKQATFEKDIVLGDNAKVAFGVAPAFDENSHITGSGTVQFYSEPADTVISASRFSNWTGEFICGWALSKTPVELSKYGSTDSTVTIKAMTAGCFSKTNPVGTIKIAGSVTTGTGYGDNTSGRFDWENTTTFDKLILAEGGSLNFTWDTGAYGVGFKINTLYPRGGQIALASNKKTHLSIGAVDLTAEPALNTRIVQITPNGSHVYNNDSTPAENGPINVTVTTDGVTRASDKKLFFNNDGLYVAVTMLNGVCYTNYQDAVTAYNTAGSGEIEVLDATAGGIPTGWEKSSNNTRLTKIQVPITWDINGNKTITYVDYGDTPSYSGETPTKAADAQYTYEFTSWSPAFQTVTEATTYTAQFSSTINQYNITFVDEDGTTVLKAATAYDYGTAAGSIVLPDATPTKATTAQYTYAFAGWSPALENVTSNATYTATYAPTLRTYTITFVDDDGTTTIKSESYGFGTAAEFIAPANPTKAPTKQYTYTFAGWSPTVAEVTGDATYTATYNSTVNQYTVTFVDEDGTTVLKAAAEYDYGTVVDAIEKPADPTKTATAQYTYAFAGWSPVIVDVAGNATYTATYTPTLRTYNITFVDEDGETVLKEATAYDYGTAAESIEKPADPTKAATDEFTYTFEGWTPTVAEVTADATYRATYSSTRNKYAVKVGDADSIEVEYGSNYTFTAPVAAVSQTDEMQVFAVGTSYENIGVTNEFVRTVTGSITFSWDILATNYYFATSEMSNGSISGATTGWMPDGTNFTLTANATPGYGFARWTGDTNGCTVVGSTGLSVTMDRARTIGAEFATLTGYTITPKSNWFAVGAERVVDRVHTDPEFYEIPVEAPAGSTTYRIETVISELIVNTSTNALPIYSGDEIPYASIAPATNEGNDYWFGWDRAGSKWQQLGSSHPVDDGVSTNAIEFTINDNKLNVTYFVDGASIGVITNAGVDSLPQLTQLGFSGYGRFQSYIGEGIETKFEISTIKDVDAIKTLLKLESTDRPVIEAALAEKGANGLRNWQNVVLGLPIDDANKKPFVAPVQNANPNEISFAVGNCVPNDNLRGKSPKFQVYEVTSGGAAVYGDALTSGEPVGIDKTATIDLSRSSGVRYFKIKIVFE